jgi:hypothetical protein
MVIDVSGSMAATVDVVGEAGEAEATGLTVLDICKHSAKTVLHMLRPRDVFSLVSFSSAAAVVAERAPLAAPGSRAAAIARVESLRAGGGTNLWDGLVKGLELANAGVDDGVPRVASVMLLTDGVPTIEPPRGHLPMLARWLDRHALRCTVDAFGFGYSLDSALLAAIAGRCGGCFSFVPNAQLVGTVFVHYISNLLSTSCRAATLSLEPAPGWTVGADGVARAHGADLATWGAAVPLGALRLGQTRDVPVRLTRAPGAPPPAPGAPLLTATLRYTCLSGADGSAGADGVAWAGGDGDGGGDAAPPDVERRNWHVARLAVVDCLRAVTGCGRAGHGEGKELVARLVDSVAALQPFGEGGVALQKDVTGQVSEAVSREDWFGRWGLHYLTSLQHAHLLQLCCNFKDPGLQLYGGRVFSSLRDEADDVFLNLPLPTPPPPMAAAGRRRGPFASGLLPVVQPCAYRPQQQQEGGLVQLAAAQSRMVSSRQFHNRDDPCLDGGVRARAADGREVCVRELAKGDVVETRRVGADGGGSHPSTSKIMCIVKTVVSGAVSPMVELRGTGVRVTPYHPVRFGDGGAWIFPCEAGRVTLQPTESLYSVVLHDRDQVMVLAGGVQAVTLGHGLQGAKLRHDYLGSPLVVEDLKKFDGWASGAVQLRGGCMRRSRESGLVCGFHRDAEVPPPHAYSLEVYPSRPVRRAT